MKIGDEVQIAGVIHDSHKQLINEVGTIENKALMYNKDRFIYGVSIDDYPVVWFDEIELKKYIKKA